MSTSRRTVDDLITDRVLSAVCDATLNRLNPDEDHAVAVAVLGAIPIGDLLDFIAATCTPHGYRIIRDTDPRDSFADDAKRLDGIEERLRDIERRFEGDA